MNMPLQPMLPPLPPPINLVSVWMDPRAFRHYMNGGHVEAASTYDEAENKTINVLVEASKILKVYEHIDFCEFDIKG